MFKKLLSQVQEQAKALATPENIAKAKELASKAASAARAGGAEVQSRWNQRVQNDAERAAHAHVHNAKVAAIESVKGGALRGTEIVDTTSQAMRDRLSAKTSATTISVGGVPVASEDEQQHFLLCGAPGTGKSVEIKKALRTIRERGQRAVVYDPSGEFVSLFYRPQIDHILNPLDARGARWNPWLDVESFEYQAFARSLIPEPTAQADPFWSAAARSVVEALLAECQSLDELVWLGLSAPLGDLAAVVRDAGFEGMIGAEKTFQSTRSTLSVYLRSLALLPNVNRDEEAFSVRTWLEDDDAGWIFLSVNTRARDAMRPLVSLWLDTVARHALGLRPDPERRIWLVLDELPSLQKLPSLPPALAEGRKYGLTGILGVQALGQLQETYGEKQAAALWSMPKTRLYLRVSDAGTAEQVSKELGDVQLRRHTKSTSESSNEGFSNNSSHSGQGGGSSSSSGSSTSSSRNEQIVTERAVLPAEIAGLPDLRGYLRTGGSHIVAKVAIDFAGLPRQGDQPDFQPIPARALPKGRVEQPQVEEVEDTEEVQVQETGEVEGLSEIFGGEA